MITRLSLAAFVLAAAAAQAEDAPPSLVPNLVHLRSGMAREWSEFPEVAHGHQLEVKFATAKNDREFTLQLRQQDVKQTWRVSINDRVLGTLPIDENDQTLYFPVPTGTLIAGENVLRIAPAGGKSSASDDIRVGQVRLIGRPVADVLSEGSVDIQVTEAETDKPLPCRLTIVDASGSLQMTGASSSDELAVRPGVIYAARGHAKIGLPLGRYTVYAGRGFEFSLAKTEIVVARGPALSVKLQIRREVPTEGYVACDTHVHTVTYSGHGDCTIAERMITLAGEGIELPIATDHNVHVDYAAHAAKAGVSEFFTPVMGNEVTTGVGHFNIFPIQAKADPPDYKSKEWRSIFDGIFGTPGVKVAILNHARDLHSGVRPFGPKLHNAVVGENLDGWPMRFNGMEVVNSGATQTDALQLFHDWMGLLNAGRVVTPVGASDSHDVVRHFVGQARTYVRASDQEAGKIDVDAAVNSFVQGQVLVSYGLIAEMTVNDKYRSGEMAAPAGDETTVALRVLGPHWVTADRIQLYANGRLIRDESVSDERNREEQRGVKSRRVWHLPRLKHDSHLVAIALGPGIDGPWWKTAKAYQPTSPDWEAHVIGCSGAIRVDGDGDGRWSSPRDYAERAMAAAQGDLAKLLAGLEPFDEATASQAALLFQKSGKSLLSDESSELLKSASEQVQRGFGDYLRAWRECEVARAGE